MGIRFDVCNGDADGLCAAVQWRRAHPGDARIVTGLKRDITLLEGVQAGEGDEVNVFDVSIERNRTDVMRLIAAGARLRYFDHHAAPTLAAHPRLELHIDCASDVCTSLLVDRQLGAAQRAWALAGAYGDNLAPVAHRLGQSCGYGARDLALLQQLGEAINYNAYGDDVDDVLVGPGQMYELMSRYGDPCEMSRTEPVIGEIAARRAQDLRRAMDWPPHWQGARGAVLVLPDAGWSRRVIGCLANELANARPHRAHAILKPVPGNAYLVSVRAPLDAPVGADLLCRRFGGGGRARAAGIDGLPMTDLQAFVDAFAEVHWGVGAGDIQSESGGGSSG